MANEYSNSTKYTVRVRFGSVVVCLFVWMAGSEVASNVVARINRVHRCPTCNSLASSEQARVFIALE